MRPSPDTEVLYGVNPAFETVLAARRPVRGAYINENSRSRPRMQTLEALLRERNVPVQWVDKGKLNSLARTSEHQGVVIRTGAFCYTPSPDLMDERLLVMLDNIEDPHNMGAIIRSADVFGFHGVLLARRGCPGVIPSVVKASAGACEHLRIAMDRSPNQYVKAALAEGFRVFALDGNGETELTAVAPQPDEKVLLVVGGESKGVRQFILREAHAVIRIPQQGHVNSLNASVAAGIALHWLSRGRQHP